MPIATAALLSQNKALRAAMNTPRIVDFGIISQQAIVMASQTPVPASNSGTPRSPFRKWLLGGLVGLAALLVIGSVCVSLVAMFGSVKGTEFCPQTFERRRFSLLEIPWVGIPIRNPTRDDITGSVETYLVAEKLWIPDQVTAPDWQLVELRRGLGEPTKGDAALLMAYLDACFDDGNHVWQQWSDEHADLAKVLWPAVGEAARRGDYLVVPTLFEEARGASSPAELQKALAATMPKEVGTKK